MKYIKIFLKLIGIGCFAVIILFLIFIIIIVGIDSYNEGVASNPDRIISKVDMTFPSYKVKNAVPFSIWKRKQTRPINIIIF